jgi:uncharacterized protein (DUF4415 family)
MTAKSKPPKKPYKHPLTAKELAAMSDSDIDYSDIAELDEEFWKHAKLVVPKQQVTLRLDRDVLAWFRKQGKGYQTRMNQALRAFVAEHLHSG